MSDSRISTAMQTFFWFEENSRLLLHFLFSLAVPANKTGSRKKIDSLSKDLFQTEQFQLLLIAKDSFI